MKQLGYAIMFAAVPLFAFGLTNDGQSIAIILIGGVVGAVGIIANYARYHRQGGR